MKSSEKRTARSKHSNRKQRLPLNGISYEALEPRQMLATDLGLNLTGATLGNETNDLIADVTGDANENFVIQAVNGHFGIYDRGEGLRVYSATLEEFFESTGAALFDDLENPQVMFDAGAQRWFVAAQGEGAGNWLHVAFSDTADPTGTWQQLQFVGDSTGTHFNDDLILGIDVDAVYLTTNNHLGGVVTPLPDNVSIYSIPKSDIFADDPTITNMSRFEALNPAVYGVSIQVASNFDASDGMAIAIGKTPWEFTAFASVTRTNILGAGAAGATLSAPTQINLEVDFLDPIYLRAVNPWQIAEVDGEGMFLTKDNYRVSVAEANGKLFGAHVVQFDDKDDTTSEQNGVNWFEIDIATNTYVTSDAGIQNGIILMPGGHLSNVSIDVNDFGVVVLNYNTSGNNETDGGVDRPITYSSTIGITGNGLNSRLTQLEGTVNIQNGLELYDPSFTPSWGDFSTVRSDSADPESGFWGFQIWANTNDRWSAQLSNIRARDMRVRIVADNNDNDIFIRRHAANDRLIEIEIDGVVTDVLPYSVFGTVQVFGLGGDDTFTIDYTNGDPVPEGGLFLDGGLNNDSIFTNSVDGVEYVVQGAGSGTYNTISRFAGMENLHGWTGDDTFAFEGLGSLGGVVQGKEGYNTLSFFNRSAPTAVQTNAFSAFMGFDGVGTPLAGFSAISNMIGGQIGGDVWTPMDEPDSHWFIDDEDSYYTLAPERLDFSYWDEINGTSFVDTFNVLSNSLDPLGLHGLDGDDIYNFSSDAPTNTGRVSSIGGLIYANAGPGQNQMVVSNESGTSTNTLVLSRRISGFGEIVYDSFGGTFDIKLIGSPDNDTFSLHSFRPTNTLIVESRAGDDFFSIQDLSKASVKVLGGSGDDTYSIEMIQGVSFRNLEIIDSVDAENDRVILLGTVLDEVYNITDTTFTDLEVSYIGIESFGIEGRGGNDVFNIMTNTLPLELKGEDGDDTFNLGNDVSAAELIGGNIKIDGGTGTNELNINNRTGGPTKVVINGAQVTGLLMGGGIVSYVATNGSFGQRPDDGFGGIRFTGSETDNDDVTVNGVAAEHWVRLAGLGGNDHFSIRAATAADVWAGGGTGNDQYHVFVGAGARTVSIVDADAGEKNRIEYFGTAGNDSFIVGKTGFNVGADMVETTGNYQFFRVVGFGGNDDITYVQSPALINHFLGGDGNDTMNINNSIGIQGFRGVGNDGVDTFNLNELASTTFTRGVGGDGADVFNVSENARGKASFDGQQGNDTYNVRLMRTGFRQVDTRDTGGGFDVTNVVGTNFIDAFEVRATRIKSGGQLVGYSDTIDRLEVDAGNGADTVDVFATVAPLMIVKTGAGNDTVLVTGTSHAQDLKIFGGAGSDTMTVKSTQSTTNLELHGEAGADTFNIGASITKDNGNLGRIRGGVVVQADTNIAANDPGDWLYVNDAAVTGAYSYEVTPTGVNSIPGPRNIPRPQFAGVSFNGTLNAFRLDGTQGANYFSVTPSAHTAMEFDGNDPNTGGANGDSIKLESTAGNLTVTNATDGHGFWSFTNVFQQVDFLNMEMWEEGGALPSLLANDSDNDDDTSASPLALVAVPTGILQARSNGLAGMQDADSRTSDPYANDSDFVREFDQAVEEFEFDFDLV